MSTVTSAIGLIGLTPIAKRVKKMPSAVIKWRDQGRLPRTELAGLTDYARVIADLSADTTGPVTVEQLLADTRTGWERRISKQNRQRNHGRRK